jgi:aminopeptidase N
VKKFYADNRFKKASTDQLREAMELSSGRDLSRFFERWIYDNGIPQLRYTTAVEGQELVVRFEQVGEELYDVPVTMAVTYTDGKTSEFIAVVNEASNEARFPLAGTMRTVEANPDGAAIAIIDQEKVDAAVG